MIVRYKHENYCVGLKDAFIIWILQINLLCLRMIRNIHRLMIECKNIIIVIPIWFLFLGIAYVWGKQIGKVTDIWGLLWELKASIFTSIILVTFVNVYNGQKSYKARMEQQFYLYYDLLIDLEKITKLLCEYCIGESYSEEWIFYTQERCEKFCDFLETHDGKGKRKESIIGEIKDTILLLERLKECVKANGIISWNKERYRKNHDQMLLGSIDEIGKVFREYENKESNKIEKSTFLPTIWEMYCIIERCRIPWRRDYDINQKIRTLIAKKNEDALCFDYYTNLFMNE